MTLACGKEMIERLTRENETPEVNNMVGGSPYSKLSCYMWLMRGSYSVLEL